VRGWRVGLRRRVAIVLVALGASLGPWTGCDQRWVESEGEVGVRQAQETARTLEHQLALLPGVERAQVHWTQVPSGAAIVLTPTTNEVPSEPAVSAAVRAAVRAHAPSMRDAELTLHWLPPVATARTEPLVAVGPFRVAPRSATWLRVALVALSLAVAALAFGLWRQTGERAAHGRRRGIRPQ
jgi:hypothetical protein